MADIELMTTKHSNDIITRLDDLEEQIVRKGIPKGMELKRYNTGQRTQLDITLEGKIKVLYMNVKIATFYERGLNINGYDFKKEAGILPRELAIYNENYFINRHYGNLDMPTSYIYVNDWDDFIKYYEKNKDDKRFYNMIIKDDIYINYIRIYLDSKNSNDKSGIDMTYIPY